VGWPRAFTQWNNNRTTSPLTDAHINGTSEPADVSDCIEREGQEALIKTSLSDNE
jgi:hypothetical protein